MKVRVFLKSKKEPIEFNGDRVDILELVLQGKEHYQIRVFRGGFSKSEYILKNLVKKIDTKE